MKTFRGGCCAAVGIAILLLSVSAASALAAPRAGTLDNSFGKRGVVLPSLGQTHSGGSWSDAALQPDGKVVAVESRLGIVQRFLPDGTPDPDFKGDAFPGPGFHATAVALQADGRILVAYGSEIRRLNPDGSADSSFAGDGVLSTPVLLNDLAVQPDGAIVGAGAHVYAPCTRLGCPKEVGLVRYLPNGAADDSFGGDGLVTTRLGFDEGVSHVLVQPDGAILAQTISRVIRYLPNGSLDPSFADGGVLSPSSTAQDIRDVGFRSGDVMVLLSRDFQAGTDFTVAAYDGTGAPDPTFNGDGFAPVDLPGTLDSQRLLVLPDGSLLVGASDAAQNEPPRLVVAKLDSTGAVDPTFGDGGAASLPEEDEPAGVNQGSVNALLAAPSGEIYFAGAADRAAPVSVEPVLAALTATGAFDPAFGSNGAVIQHLLIPSSDSAAAATVDRRGRILVAGSTNADEALFHSDVSLIRLRPNGARDRTFGSDGQLLIDLPSPFPPYVVTGSAATAVAVQKDGRILVGATSALGTMLLRLRPNGATDGSFGSAGTLRLPDVGEISQLTQLRGGGILVASKPAASAITLLKLRPDGRRDPTFGQQGKVRLGYKRSPVLGDVSVRPDGRILVCGMDNRRFSLWSLLPDGRRDPSFGRRGEVLIGPHPSACTAARPLTDGGALAGGLSRGVTAFTASGAIDRDYGQHGRTGILRVTCCASLLGQGGTTLAVDGTRFSAAALTADGRLIKSFGSGGYLVPGAAVAGAETSAALLQRGDLVLVGNRGRHGESLQAAAETDSQVVIARYRGP
jgi:uncharacterized delta-60 repeat protein